MKLLFALALSTRVLVAWRTHVPARDAESYLWMAERAAEGELASAFQSVFHPLYPLMIGALLALAPSLSPVAAGQIVSCGCGALAVVPLFEATRRLFGQPAAVATAVLYAVGIWFVRHPADCLSEGPFFLAVALATRVLCSERIAARHGIALGVLAGLAYGLRPEGAAIAILGVPWLLARRELRTAALAAASALIVAAPFPIGWAVLGDGFTLTPKAGFNYAQGVGQSDTAAVAHYFTHLLRVPGAALEAIGYVALPLAILGAWDSRRRSWLDPTRVMLGLFALQCVVIPALRSNIRFLAGFGLLLLPFAGHGIAQCAGKLAAKPMWLKALLCTVVVAGDVVRLPQARREARVVLIELGQHLRDRLRPGDRIATEMPRLAYFAGIEPGPPRPIPREELLEQARDPATRFIAVIPARSNVTAADFAAIGFDAVELPGSLRELADERGIVVMKRR